MRQSIVQEDRLHEAAKSLASQMKNGKYESQITTLKQKLEECEHLLS
jgi:hypothetical protein